MPFDLRQVILSVCKMGEDEKAGLHASEKCGIKCSRAFGALPSPWGVRHSAHLRRCRAKWPNQPCSRACAGGRLLLPTSATKWRGKNES
jgi:hypothetical protein